MKRTAIFGLMGDIHFWQNDQKHCHVDNFEPNSSPLSRYWTTKTSTAKLEKNSQIALETGLFSLIWQKQLEQELLEAPENRNDNFLTQIFSCYVMI